MPMKFRISSDYGALEEVRDGRVHQGVDLAMPRGTELHSIVSGTVDHIVDNAGGLGKGVFVRGANGDVHIYGHLDKINVKPGGHVDAGDLIGLSGNTGHSTGPHLHFGLMQDGQFSDPAPLLDEVQHYSGEIAGPSILGIKGPAVHLYELSNSGGVKEHVEAAVQEKLLEWLQAAGEVLHDLSFGIGLVGCAALIILGAVGLKNGYRWAGLLFTTCSILRYLTDGGER